MSDPEFVPGLFVKPPHPRAPEFVRGSVSIKRDELIAWLQLKSDEWINIDVKESRGGKWFATVNTWKPEAKNPAPKPAAKPAPAAFPTASAPQMSSGGFDDFDSDIPF